MRGIRRMAIAAAAAMLSAAPAAQGWELAGEHTVWLHARDGAKTAVATVRFTAEGERRRFELHMAHQRFKDFFLSMKEFKCLESSEEIQCHVPYPYAHPATVSGDDLRWLEHSLLFLFKAPKDFGARLWNGIYYRMQLTPQGIVGIPHAVDLNEIGAPPAEPSRPPYAAADLSPYAAGARWFGRLTIE